jgi:hypothetical protein
MVTAGSITVDEAAMPLPAMPIAAVRVVTVEKEEVVVAETADAVFQRNLKPSSSPPALDTPPVVDSPGSTPHDV